MISKCSIFSDAISIACICVHMYKVLKVQDHVALTRMSKPQNRILNTSCSSTSNLVSASKTSTLCHIVSGIQNTRGYMEFAFPRGARMHVCSSYDIVIRGPTVRAYGVHFGMPFVCGLFGQSMWYHMFNLNVSLFTVFSCAHYAKLFPSLCTEHENDKQELHVVWRTLDGNSTFA